MGHNSRINKNRSDLERVQNGGARVIMGQNYETNEKKTRYNQIRYFRKEKKKAMSTTCVEMYNEWQTYW